MAVPDDVIAMLQDEIAWAREDSASPRDELPIKFQSIEDWTRLDLTKITRSVPFAVRVDGDVLYDDGLDPLRQPGYLTDLNPRYVSFRVLGAGLDHRTALIFIRSDICPRERDFEELGYRLAADQ